MIVYKITNIKAIISDQEIDTDIKRFKKNSTTVL